MYGSLFLGTPERVFGARTGRPGLVPQPKVAEHQIEVSGLASLLVSFKANLYFKYYAKDQSDSTPKPPSTPTC